MEVEKSSKTVITEDQSVFVRHNNGSINRATSQEISPLGRTDIEITCIKQILNKISSQGIEVTEAQIGLLRQYQNLA